MLLGAAAVQIYECMSIDVYSWALLRHELWPQQTLPAHVKAVSKALENDTTIAFMASDDIGNLIGFAEATLRNDYVNGCRTAPVAFLEGIYVRPDYRLQGVARNLCEAVADWAASLGCSEFASDVPLANADSQKMHAALGFVETERVQFFSKELRKAS